MPLRRVLYTASALSIEQKKLEGRFFARSDNTHTILFSVLTSDLFVQYFFARRLVKINFRDENEGYLPLPGTPLPTPDGAKRALPDSFTRPTPPNPVDKSGVNSSSSSSGGGGGADGSPRAVGSDVHDVSAPAAERSTPHPFVSDVKATAASAAPAAAAAEQRADRPVDKNTIPRRATPARLEGAMGSKLWIRNKRFRVGAAPPGAAAAVAAATAAAAAAAAASSKIGAAASDRSLPVVSAPAARDASAGSAAVRPAGSSESDPRETHRIGASMVVARKVDECEGATATAAAVATEGEVVSRSVPPQPVVDLAPFGSDVAAGVAVVEITAVARSWLGQAGRGRGGALTGVLAAGQVLLEKVGVFGGVVLFCFCLLMTRPTPDDIYKKDRRAYSFQVIFLSP